MKAHWNYLKYVLSHKYHVFHACLEIGVPWYIALVHDWIKFLPCEWGPYVRQFFNPDGSKKAGIRDKTGAYDPAAQPVEFQKAWLHHQRAKHHWQAYISLGDFGKLVPIEIPKIYVKEMIADWRGAGKAQGSKTGPAELRVC